MSWNNNLKNKYITYLISICLLFIISIVVVFYLLNIYQWSLDPYFGFGYRKFSGWAIVGKISDDGYKAGFRIGDKFLAVNGKPVKTLDTLISLVDREIGSFNQFTVLREGEKHTIVFQTTKFGCWRAALNFGVSWLMGVLIICIGSFVFFTTPFEHKRWSFFLFCLCAGLYMTFFNQKSHLWPSWVQIFELIGLCFLPATILHMSFIFPFYRDYHPRRMLYTLCTYAFSFLLFISIKAFSSSFSGSPKYLRLLVLFYFFLSILTFIIVLFYQYRRTTSRLTEMKIKVVLLGFFISFFLPLIEPILSSLFGIFIFSNIDLAMLPFILVFPLSIGYAIAKHDLFEIDVFIKRTAGYLLTTASIAVFYILFIFLANRILSQLPQKNPFQSAHMVNFFFILAVVFFLNPLTNNAQDIVDRLFYRRKYDYKEPVKQFLKDITSIFKLDLIIERLQNILSDTMFIEDIQVFLYNPDQNKYSPFDFSLKKINNSSVISVPASSPLVKLLIEEKKEIHRDVFYEVPRYFYLSEKIFPFFESWKAQLIFPFITHSKMSGFITLGNMKSGRHYNIADTEFIKIISDQTAIALENVNSFQDRIEQEKIKEELKIAGVIQKRMLPDASPQINNISIHARIIPSREIGGDFYDFIKIPSQEEKEVGIILGDVSGHGISGALLMSAAHSICQNQALFLKDIVPMVEEANRLLIRETKKKAFVAMIFTFLLPNKDVAIVNAGLPSPLYYNHKKKQVCFLENEGERFPLGIVENAQYIPLTVTLEKGDLLLFYTDGIVEVKNKDREIFSYDRLKELFSRLVYLEPEEISERIIKELKHFSGNKRFADDDMTIIIVKHAETHPLDTFLSLPVSFGGIGIIMQCVKSLAQLCNLDEGSLVQLKNEVKNSYLHACDHNKLMDYIIGVSLLQNKSMANKRVSEENVKMQTLNQPKAGKTLSDGYYVELLPKNERLTDFNNGNVARLIVNFVR